MNQILITQKNIYIYPKTKKYLIIFVFSIIISTIILFYLLNSYFSRIKCQKKTKSLKRTYDITTLYYTNTNYNVLKLSGDMLIIGLIEIPKINISYPILLNCNENLLKTSVCRFCGPLPNKQGNLCIVGHNYKNGSMFSNLHKLNINDSIFITDLNNIKLEYVVYNKFKVNKNNLQCTTNSNQVEITIITCNNNNNSLRTVIKTKMKE